METQKPNEQIDWQFVSLYYPLLINQLDTIRKLMIYTKDYESAYGELVQIFNTLNNSIRIHDIKEYEKLNNEIIVIDNALYEFKMAQISRMPRKARAIKLTKTRQQVIQNINLFHRDLMACMDNMNMFFKRKKVDNRLEIYK